MWWEWTEITLLDSVLFSLLSMLILYLVGSGFLRLICARGKWIDPFSSFDFYQKINFRILFGFIFIFLLVLIFSIFNLSFLASTLLIIAIALIGFVATRHSFKLKLPKKTRFQNYACIIIVFVVLLVTIFLSSMLIAGFYGSTNDDAADHTLIVRIILDNPNALITRSAQPYYNFFNYPPATHVLCAFFVTLLGVPIQKIVIMLSVILPILIALSFYSTLKCLFESKVLSILGLIIAAFFTIGLSWGPVSWGGLPVLLSLYLSISSMGLIFVFLLKKKMTLLNASLIGLIFFIASQTYPVALLIVSLWFLLILSVKVLPKFRNSSKWKVSVPSLFSRINIAIIIAFLIPVLFSIPYFYSMYTHYIAGVQFNQLSSSDNILTETVKARIGFNWLFDIPALSLFFSGFGSLLALAPYSLILLIVLFIPRVSQRTASIFPAREFTHSLFLIYFFMLLIMSYLTLSLYLPINFLSTFLSPERVWQHIFIPATIMTAFVLFSAIYFFYLVFKRLFHDSDKVNVVKLSKLSKNRILACALLALLIFNVGLLSIPIVNDQQVQYNKIGSLFNTYETLNQDDILLMNWIKENIPSNEHILISAGDSGQFLTAVTQRQTISICSGSKNYSSLMTLLTANSSDLRAIPLMIEYNISYVYIGSTATTYSLEYSYRRQFNATQFLSTPYFTLTKEIGNAWLFQFNVSAALAAYEAAGPLPEFVDQPRFSHYINILASEGGYTGPPAGYHYGSGVLAIYAYPNEGYQLNHWKLNGSYLCGAENPVNVDYWNWNVQAVFTKNT